MPRGDRVTNGEKVMEWFRRAPWWTGPAIAAAIYILCVTLTWATSDAKVALEKQPGNTIPSLSWGFYAGILGRVAFFGGRFVPPVVMMFWAAGMLFKLIDLWKARSRPAEAPAPTPGNAPARTSDVPPCPDCGRPMAKRTARRGANQGSSFWGCSTYPQCRGTRELSTR